MKQLYSFGLKGSPIAEQEDILEKIIKLNPRITIFNNKKLEREQRATILKDTNYPKRSDEKRKQKDKVEKKIKKNDQSAVVVKDKLQEEEKEEKAPKEEYSTFEVIKEMIEEEVKEEKKKKNPREGILKIEKKNPKRMSKLEAKIETRRVQKALKNEAKIEGWD